MPEDPVPKKKRPTPDDPNEPRSSHICYVRRMGDVPSRELRNDTRGVLRRVENGEEVTITVDGRPIAVLRPLEQRKRWMMRDEFVARFARNQADAGLTAELAEIVSETTDDIELR